MKLDMRYIASASFRGDILICMKTIYILFNSIVNSYNRLNGHIINLMRAKKNTRFFYYFFLTLFFLYLTLFYISKVKTVPFFVDNFISSGKAFISIF